MNRIIQNLAVRVLVPTPVRLRSNHIRVDKSDLGIVERSVRTSYHVGWRDPTNYSQEAYNADLLDHTSKRLSSDRRFIVPWLDHARPLKNQTILEIGCGTGSSTVALAEQGARVTGIDIDEGALAVAKERSAVYGIDADFIAMNAGELDTLKTRFDHIIFFASLEHMTLNERLAALRDAWSMLPVGGHLTIVETPNRLWFFDEHTSRLPFFNWLPDELAFQQSRRSPRENFRELYREYTSEAFEHFLRRGRGVSYHELDAAIRPIDDIKVISSLSQFWGARYKYRQSRLARRYKAVLKSVHPTLDNGFLDDYLYLVLEKT